MEKVSPLLLYWNLEKTLPTKELPPNFPAVSYLQAIWTDAAKRLNLITEDAIIQEQSGFRSGKSCTSQLLNLTQHIEDGFEKSAITGTVFVDLSAAYDTVNHKLLLNKLYDLTRDGKQPSLHRWSQWSEE